MNNTTQSATMAALDTGIIKIRKQQLLQAINDLEQIEQTKEMFSELDPDHCETECIRHGKIFNDRLASINPLKIR